MAPRRKTKKKNFREQIFWLGGKNHGPTLQIKWSVPYDWKWRLVYVHIFITSHGIAMTLNKKSGLCLYNRGH